MWKFPLFLLVSLFLLPVSSHAVDDSTGDPAEVQVIRAAYSALERYAEWPSHRLSFELSGFETLERPRFDEIQYAELATLPEGDVVGITRSTQNLDASDLFFRRYIPYWESKDFNWRSAPETGRMFAMSVAEVFAEAAKDSPELGAVDRLTRFRVRVHLDDRSREYVAAFLWLPSDGDEGDLKFRVLDHVTQGVAEAASESHPTAAEARRELHRRRLNGQVEGAGAARGVLRGAVRGSGDPVRSQPSDPVSGTAPGGDDVVWAASTATCTSFNTPYAVSDGHSGSEGHLSGRHYSEANFTIGCSCDSSCTSACQARIATTTKCEDEGSVWDSCHHLATANNSSSGFQGGGTLQGAECGAGYGCVKKSCSFCLCSLSVTVSVLNKTVSFTTSGTPDWQGNAQASATCPRCSEEQQTCSESRAGATGSNEDVHSVQAALDSCTPIDRQATASDSPIVVDLAGDGFRFTSAAEGVRFDLDADGRAEQVAWTLAGSDDAFLVTDWNQNGIIDDGRELFGNRSAQPEPPAGDERHGYHALRWYDEDAGGNRDGWISAADPWYEDLWLWLDANHDGYSQPEELARLRDFGVERIDLDYVESRRRDTHGNELRYTSFVVVADGPRALLPGRRSKTLATDVFLVRAQP